MYSRVFSLEMVENISMTEGFPLNFLAMLFQIFSFMHVRFFKNTKGISILTKSSSQLLILQNLNFGMTKTMARAKTHKPPIQA